MLSTYLWLLLCYAQYANSDLLQDYEEISISLLTPPVDAISMALPNDLGIDGKSGCLCRGSKNKDVIVCFGNYECKKTPLTNDKLCLLIDCCSRRGRLDDCRRQVVTAEVASAVHNLPFVC